MGKGLINLSNLNQGINMSDLDLGTSASKAAPVYIKPQTGP